MRVVGDNVGQPQVLPIRDALKLADELELDLIEISPKACLLYTSDAADE